MSDDERRARALFRLDKRLYGFPDTLIWQDIDEGARELYRDAARAIRKSDKAAGMVLMPREPTAIMLDRGRSQISWSGVIEGDHVLERADMRDAYHAMIAAKEARDEG